MKRIILLLALLPCLAYSQPVEVIKLADLEKLINMKSEKIKVLNFWATWCAPCVKELPLFDSLQSANNTVEVLLVSMDLDLDPNPEKVHRFVTRKKVQSKVVMLNEKDPNSYIDKIDKKWSGALPATILISPQGKRLFHEGELSAKSLADLIKEATN